MPPKFGTQLMRPCPDNLTVPSATEKHVTTGTDTALAGGMSKAAVRLRAWFIEQATTARQLAAEMDVREETVSRWLSGRLKPSRMARHAIAHVTRDAVSVDAWEET
jgi:hypothetical protein